MVSQTSLQFDTVVGRCKDIFLKKMQDYGTAWRILRVSSITDQISIKAQRIRSVEEKGKQLVSDDIATEFIGIINYAVIALIQLELGHEVRSEISDDQVRRLFDKHVLESKRLMENKNHDYGEAWRNMRTSSMT